MTENTCYIGVVGGEYESADCYDSIVGMQRREGDGHTVWRRGTKGFENRQFHIDRWIEQTTHDYCLLLDSDMVFPADTLERLRSHELPYVSGFYMRRSFPPHGPMLPVWYKPFTQWPFEPMVELPEPGRLHPIGASGWGCMLLRRDLITAVKPLLKGEPEIIEDDMDIYPYHLDVVLDALQAGDIEVLRREIRPLRARRDNVGSDVRFPYFAAQAGFQLMGDPDVRCGHIIHYPLGWNDYAPMPPEMRQDMIAAVERDVQQRRTEVYTRLRRWIDES